MARRRSHGDSSRCQAVRCCRVAGPGPSRPRRCRIQFSCSRPRRSRTGPRIRKPDSDTDGDYAAPCRAACGNKPQRRRVVARRRRRQVCPKPPGCQCAAATTGPAECSISAWTDSESLAPGRIIARPSPRSARAWRTASARSPTFIPSLSAEPC